MLYWLKITASWRPLGDEPGGGAFDKIVPVSECGRTGGCNHATDGGVALNDYLTKIEVNIVAGRKPVIHKAAGTHRHFRGQEQYAAE